MSIHVINKCSQKILDEKEQQAGDLMLRLLAAVIFSATYGDTSEV